jgi:hypothetical protein
MTAQEFFEEVISCFSEPRLAEYKDLFDSPKPHIPLTAHIMLEALSSTLYMPLQFMELTLRNKTYNALVKIYSAPDMRARIQKKCPLPAVPENWYEWMPTARHTKDAIQTAKKRAAGSRAFVPHDDVISLMSLGTWVNILREREDSHDNFYFWGKAVDMIFPHRMHMEKSGILKRLDEAREIRNRLFHHKAVWKAGNVKTFREAVERLHDRLFVICDIIAWMSQPAWKTLEKFIPFASFNEAYQRGVDEFQKYDFFEE